MRLREAIVATFNQPLDESTVNETSVSVWAGERLIASSTSVIEEGRTLRIILDELPETPVELTVELSGDLVSRDGTALEETSWSFVAPPWVQLGALTAVEGVGTGAYDVTTDAAGNVFVSWVQGTADDSKARSVYVRSWNEQEGWTSVGDGITHELGANRPAIAVDSSGTPVMTFSDTDPDGTGFQLVTYRFEEDSWKQLGEPFAVDDEGHGELVPAKPALVLDANGNPSLAWADYLDLADTDGLTTRFAQWTGEEWQNLSEHRASESSVRSHGAALAVDGQGRPILAFHDYDGFGGPDGIINSQLYVRRRNAEGLWETLGTTPNPVEDQAASDASLALDADDHPWVAFRSTVITGGPVLVSRWTGSEWQQVGEAFDVLEDPSSTSLWPELAIDSQGAAHVLWYEGGIRHLRKWNGTEWIAVGGGTIDFGASLLAIDSADVPVLVGLEVDDQSVYRVVVHRLNI